MRAHIARAEFRLVLRVTGRGSWRTREGNRAVRTRAEGSEVRVFQSVARTVLVRVAFRRIAVRDGMGMGGVRSIPYVAIGSRRSVHSQRVVHVLMIRSTAYVVEGSAIMQPRGRVVMRANKLRLAIFRQGMWVLFWVRLSLMLCRAIRDRQATVVRPMPIRRPMQPVVMLVVRRWFANRAYALPGVGFAIVGSSIGFWLERRVNLGMGVYVGRSC